MQIYFSSRKIAKLLNDQKETIRKYGPDNGRRILRRLQQIADATDLNELSKLPQTRVHELTGDRNEQISVDVKHPYRLILKSNHPETPRKPDGGMDWGNITNVLVIEIADTH